MFSVGHQLRVPAVRPIRWSTLRPSGLRLRYFRHNAIPRGRAKNSSLISMTVLSVSEASISSFTCLAIGFHALAGCSMNTLSCARRTLSPTSILALLSSRHSAPASITSPIQPNIFRDGIPLPHQPRLRSERRCGLFFRSPRMTDFS